MENEINEKISEMEILEKSEENPKITRSQSTASLISRERLKDKNDKKEILKMSEN